MTPNPSIEGTFNNRLRQLSDAPLVERVRRAWRVTSSMEVQWPGFCRAEVKEQGKGVVVK
jgi:hypothetical protein